jgi:hypothetical protein
LNVEQTLKMGLIYVKTVITCLNFKKSP